MSKTVKASFFGGPKDSMNEGTATGVSDSTPGIALPDSKKVGGYALVRYKGHAHVEKVIDFGPAKWTGRGADIGYGSRGHYPGLQTDQKVQVTYLGKDRARAIAKAKMLTGDVATKKTQPAAQAPATENPNRQAALLAYLQQRGNPSALMELGKASR